MIALAEDIALTTTVDDVVARVPGSFDILNAYGIDTCCGGRVMLADAAAHAHVDAKALLSALRIACTVSRASSLGGAACS